MGEVIYITEASDEEIRDVLREANGRLSTIEIAMQIASKRVGRPVPEDMARVQRLAQSIEGRLTSERMALVERIHFVPPPAPKSLFARLMQKLTRIG